MASKILLISTNRCVTPDPVFPLGLAYVNAALRRAGHSTSWLDYQTSGPQGVEPALTSYRPDYIGISLRNIDDVLIRKQETFFGELTAICETAHRTIGCPIILGGSGFSIFPKELLEFAGADYGICGEGDRSLPLLIEALEQGRDPSGIPGLVFRKDQQVMVNPCSPEPSPGGLEPEDRPERLVSHYLRSAGMLNLQTQRGCSFHCCYCTYPVIEGKRHRRRAPEAVAAELAMLERSGARYAFIVDSIFNSSPLHVTEICEAILRQNLKIHWGCFLRPQGLTADLMKLMARAGLSHIEFGSDNFCDEVLHAYGKGLSFDDILKSSELAQQENLDQCHFLICGGPGETARTLHEGFKNSQRLKSGVVMAVSGMRIYPGTALYERAKKEGRIDSSANLLNPQYYLAPGLTAEGMFETLRGFASQAPNWIVGDPSPAYASLVERLRQRRVVGPLWSYFSMIQRLWPQASPSNS